MVYLPPGHGGYIPFLELPCERYIGETLQWILTLSLSPLVCPLVPWLCCPLEIEETSITLSSELDCEDPGAVYGSTAFWTMQVVSVVGLLLAMANLAYCAGTLATGTQDNEEASLVALSLDLPQLTREVLSSMNIKQIKEDGKLHFIRKKVMHLLQEKYLKGLEKQRQQKEADQGANTTLPEEVPLTRRKRQAISVAIPTLQAFVPGVDQTPVDTCERDEVLLEYDECHQLLTQGPCDEDELVLMEQKTRKGYCGPRLCAPDRVFVFSDQLCHDPYDTYICPPGRRLFTSSFGTPVCGCPDGTYEEDDDLDDDVCEPLLGHISDCPAKEVFWFSDFRQPPQCLADPCHGLNLGRGSDDLPYVPSLLDGRCYQVGSRPSICSSDQYYALSLDLLRGVCSSLEEAGYLELDYEDLEYFMNVYSKFISREGAAKPSKTSKSKNTPAGTALLHWPEVGVPVITWDKPMPPALYVGQSVTDEHDPANNELDQDLVAILPTHMNAFSPPFITVNGSISLLGFTTRLAQYMSQQQKHHHRERRAPLQQQQRQQHHRERRALLQQQHHHHRERRAPLPFASPANVVEPGLSACRAGAKRDGNAKCRSTILPSKEPSSRPRRAAPPVPPSPACPSGTFRDVKRDCSSNGSGIASSINAIGLG